MKKRDIRPALTFKERKRYDELLLSRKALNDEAKRVRCELKNLYKRGYQRIWLTERATTSSSAQASTH